VKQGIGHGETTLSDALCRSCNVYFFHHAERLGPDPLLDWAVRLGFGHSTGVELPGEAEGVLPCPENIERLEHHAWTNADTQNLAVGQGSLTATPLQIARLMAAFAGDGTLVAPHILKSRSDAQPVNEDTVKLKTRPTNLHQKYARVIREGLNRVVSDPAGTAHEGLYLKEIPIAGKTGTAQTADGPCHAWFAGYVPADKPKYVVVIALEHAGDASETACPMAKQLILRMKQQGKF
jgi:penicillin-binding protein 2